MRTEEDNNIKNYSLQELINMKNIKTHPQTRYNYCPFLLDEINEELENRLILIKESLQEKEESLRDMIAIDNILLSVDTDENKIIKVNKIWEKDIESGRVAKVIGENIVNFPQSCWYPKSRKLAGDKTYYGKETINKEKINIQHLKETIEKIS